MVKWYLATYQNGAFSSDLGIIQPSEDNVYKLKNPIDSGESPVKSDWLRITITNTDNTVEEWNGSDWNENTSLTGLVNNSTYWVYGKPYSYIIVTNDQTYYLEDLTTLNDIGKTNITHVIIGNSVTSIGEGAFFQCFRLASVAIGDSVTSIGDDAFYGCENLASVTIPNSVTEIGNEAFAYCEKLTSVTIGDSVTSIGDSAFYSIGSELGTYNTVGTIIISQSTVRKLKNSDNYDSGNKYEEKFFSDTTTLTLNVI